MVMHRAVVLPVLIEDRDLLIPRSHVDRERVREYLELQLCLVPGDLSPAISQYGCMFAYTDPDRRGAGGSYAKRREVSWLTIAFFTAANHDITIPPLFQIGLMFLFMYTVVIKLRVIELRNSKFTRTLAVLLFPVTAAVTYWLCLEYGKKTPFSQASFDHDNNRVSLVAESPNSNT